MARRRQPPLFEFLGTPDRRSTAVLDGNVMGRRPVQVPVVRPSVSADSSFSVSSDSEPTPVRRAIRVPLGVLALGSAAGLTIIAVIWSLAFNLGQSEKERQLAPHLPEHQTAGASPSAQPPVAPPSAPLVMINDPTLAPAPAAAPQSEAASPAHSREPGVNYLELCTLTYRDAAAAVQYLARNGVRAALAPAKSVDPDRARANNLPHLLYVVDGVPSERFRASEAERKSLEAKVEQIGKRWQREERGPSDFSRPMWRKFTGQE